MAPQKFVVNLGLARVARASNGKSAAVLGRYAKDVAIQCLYNCVKLHNLSRANRFVEGAFKFECRDLPISYSLCFNSFAPYNRKQPYGRSTLLNNNLIFARHAARTAIYFEDYDSCSISTLSQPRKLSDLQQQEHKSWTRNHPHKRERPRPPPPPPHIKCNQQIPTLHNLDLENNHGP
jgi:hypothetical protein